MPVSSEAAKVSIRTRAPSLGREPKHLDVLEDADPVTRSKSAAR
jgi:hypothetical protein